MKPNFILELSHSGIRLRQMVQGKPQIVGEVSLDDSEFESKVATLRNDLAEKSDTPLATELRIPNSEILFTTVDDPEYDAKKTKISREKLRENAVREALEGMTPYALNDLNFVWKVKGKSELTIAAVAHETLAEAEDFAAGRGFNPVRFAARPGKAKFHGTAFFGPTELQRRRATAEAQEAEEAKAAAAQSPAPSEPKAAPPAPPKTDAAPPKSADAPPADTAPTVDSPVSDSAAPGVAKKPDPSPAKGDTPPATQTEAAAKPPLPKPVEQGEPAPVASARRLNIGEIAPLPDLDPAKDGAATDSAAGAPGQEKPRVGFSQPRINDPLPPLDDDGVIDDVPPMPVSFATRRKQQTDVQRPSPKGPLSPGAAADPADSDSRFGRIAARFAVTPENTVAAKGTVPPPPPRRVDGKKPDAAPVLRGSAGKTGTAKPGTPRVKPVVGLPDSAEAAATLNPVSDGTGKPLNGADRAAPRAAPARNRNEAEAMTVFGARDTGSQRSFVPLLIGIAIAAILAVGVWAAFLLIDAEQISGDDQTAPPDTANAVLAPPPVDPAPLDPAPEQVAVIPDAVDQTPADPAAPAPSAGTDIADLPAGSGSPPPGDGASGRASVPDSTVAVLTPEAPVAPSSETLPIAPSAPYPVSRDPLQRPASDGGTDDANIVGRYATTGIWIDAPTPPEAPSTDRVDDLYVASADPAINLDTGPTAPPLPELAAPVPLAPQLPPAPQGDGFELDNRGLVTATPDGILSPDGILITAGRPPLAPPPTPERPAAAAPELPPQPDLPRTRPRARPGGDDGEQTRLDTAAISPTQEAGLKPRPRPADAAQPPETDVAQDVAQDVADSIQDRARLAALEASGASTATPQAPLSTTPPRAPPAALIARRSAAPTPAPEQPEETAPDEPVSPYAVARSRLPKTKPGNFARTVASARAKAAAAPKQQVVTRVAAASAVTTPRIPSRASVAKQATVKNAINLGKVNLIGVYGSASNRRALVRLPSGKFVKVKVGDRVDGGRVAAIGQSQLSYTKGGRRINLAMPKG